MPTSTAKTFPAATPSRKPREDEIDAYGVTHRGKVRKDNQDHFLSVLAQEAARRPAQQHARVGGAALVNERIASLAMVADGVGGAARGETASRAALSAVTRYVSRGVRCYYRLGVG